ncbi:hypothetical protein ACL9SP_11255, partial [Priestia flexa]|uniref:hypothetical protein n=1 Tax=Priestia flexa TaxID=86664 RepID=UPI0039B66CFE
MKAKRFTFFILFCLVFSQIQPLVSSAGMDITKPAFEAVSIDKKSVKAGETVNIKVKASDKESGLARYGSLYYKSPITQKSVYVSLVYNETTST